MRLVAKALQAAKAKELPWIVGADFQDEPEAVKRWTAEMVGRAGGRLVYTEAPTVYPSNGKPRTIDYFIVSDSLAPYFESIRIFDEAATAPHRAVLVTFKSVTEPRWQWTLRTPKRFPREKPVGCARHPVAPAGEFLEEVKEATTVGMMKTKLEDVWADVALAIEAELCGVTDRYSKEGPDRKWCGRGDGPRFVKAPILPARAMGEWGRLDIESYRVLWAINRLEELASLARIAMKQGGEGAEGEADRGALNKGQQRQWDALIRKFASPSSQIYRVRQDAGKWEELARQTQRVAAKPWEALDLMETSALWARKVLENKRKVHQEARIKGWRRWVGEQLAAGGGALHKYVKRKPEPLDDVLTVRGEFTAAAQDIADTETSSWKGIWCRHGAAATAPWREERRGIVQGTVNRPTVPELRRAAASFKLRTGLGTDALPPRSFGWLSDQLLGRVAELMEAIESVGCWPGQLEDALVHLIPKDAGGKRPIGLVTSLPRIWARARRTQVVAWRRENSRDYNWMAKGRGARRAVWVQSVMEEAAKQRGIASGSVLIDLIKAFDHLLLSEVWKAGLEHGFPMNLLALSLEWSTFKRRLVYRGACSQEAVQTFSAVLPGLEHSTDFMLLALMGPLDELLRVHQGLHIFVIADDTKIGTTGTEEEVEERLGAATNDCIKILEGMQMEGLEKQRRVQQGKNDCAGVEREVKKTVEVSDGENGHRSLQVHTKPGG